MLGYLIVFILSFAVYVIFVGSLSLYDIITGIVVSGFVSIISTKYLIKSSRKLTQLKRLVYLLKYIAVFTKLEITSHIEIIKTIISGEVNPGIIEIPYDLDSDYAVTLTACSITNTPGTLVIDIDPKEKKYYVHWINMKTSNIIEAKKYVSEQFEVVSKEIFD